MLCVALTVLTYSAYPTSSRDFPFLPLLPRGPILIIYGTAGLTIIIKLVSKFQAPIYISL